MIFLRGRPPAPPSGTRRRATGRGRVPPRFRGEDAAGRERGRRRARDHDGERDGGRVDRRQRAGVAERVVEVGADRGRAARPEEVRVERDAAAAARAAAGARAAQRAVRVRGRAAVVSEEPPELADVEGVYLLLVIDDRAQARLGELPLVDLLLDRPTTDASPGVDERKEKKKTVGRRARDPAVRRR